MSRLPVPTPQRDAMREPKPSPWVLCRNESPGLLPRMPVKTMKHAPSSWNRLAPLRRQYRHAFTASIMRRLCSGWPIGIRARSVGKNVQSRRRLIREPSYCFDLTACGWHMFPLGARPLHTRHNSYHHPHFLKQNGIWCKSPPNSKARQVHPGVPSA